jgi:two-component sensor histidine kinase
LDQESIMTELASPQPLPQEQMLLHELNHRINNEFAAAISVVSLAAARSGNGEVKAALSDVAELLHQYADVHRALQMPEYDTLIDAAAYLRQLCRSISRSLLDGRKIELVLAAQPLRLPADRCWRLGMIVFELINNAARHAFTSEAGEIRVELLRADPFFQCRVMDNGSASAHVRPGRGLKIIDALSSSLGGRIEQKFGPQGSRSILIFPGNSVLQTAVQTKSQTEWAPIFSGNTGCGRAFARGGSMRKPQPGHRGRPGRRYS